MMHDNDFQGFPFFGLFQLSFSFEPNSPDRCISFWYRIQKDGSSFAIRKRHIRRGEPLQQGEVIEIISHESNRWMFHQITITGCIACRVSYLT